MKYLVFVYGTLKKGGKLHYAVANSKFVGEGTLHNFEMYNLGWYPGIVPGDGDVTGEIYDVEEGTLLHLDRVEGAPSLYTRETVIVEAEEANYECFTYVYNGVVDKKERVSKGTWNVG